MHVLFYYHGFFSLQMYEVVHKSACHKCMQGVLMKQKQQQKKKKTQTYCNINSAVTYLFNN